MEIEFITLNKARNVTLTAYIQPVGGEFPNIKKRPAILVLPGGGYRFCSDREADPVAIPYLKAGYQAFILRYSVGADATWPHPLDDYDLAMETIIGKSEEWHVLVNKIAIVGFSAGGHLAGAAATLSKHRPAAAILGYPAVSFETVDMCLSSAPDVPGAVDYNTCPCFIFTTRDDRTVHVSNIIAMIDALDKYGVAFESHIYAYGPHGYSTGDASVLAPDTLICDRAGQWVADSLAWLNDMLGGFGEGQMTEPRCPARINDDGGKYLSADCSLGYLMGQAQAKSIIEPLIEAIMERQTRENRTELLNYAKKMRLCDALAANKVSAEYAEGIDERLRAIAALLPF